MMFEKRIIEAEGNVRSYLTEGMLKKIAVWKYFHTIIVSFNYIFIKT